MSRTLSIDACTLELVQGNIADQPLTRLSTLRMHGWLAVEAWMVRSITAVDRQSCPRPANAIRRLPDGFRGDFRCW